jgi:hypothetical protein
MKNIIEVVTYCKVGVSTNIKQGKRYKLLPRFYIDVKQDYLLLLYLPSCAHLNRRAWNVYLNGVKIKPNDARIEDIINSPDYEYAFNNE